MLVMTAPRGTKYVRELAFAPTGLFAPGGMLGVLHWAEFKHGAVAAPLGANRRLVQRVVPSADGSRVFVADIEVRAVPVGGPGAGEVVWPDAGWDALKIVMSPDGSALVLSEEWVDADDLGITRVSTSPPFRVEWEAQTPRRFLCDPLFHPSGEHFVTIESRWNEGTRVVTRSASDGRELTAATVPLVTPRHAALSPDGGTLVVTEDRELFVTQVGTAATPRVVVNANRRHFTAVAFHPSGKYLGAANNDGTVRLYDTQTWAAVRSFAWDVGQPTALAFSADGALAAACTERGKVVVWDVDV